MTLGISKIALSISPSSTLAMDAKAKRLIAEGVDVIGFGAGEPDFDTPAHIKDAAIQAINNGFTKYTPAAGTFELRQAISDKLKKDNGIQYAAKDIVVNNGAKHSILNAMLAICDAGDEVIVPAPYWVSYPEIVKLAAGVPVILNTNERDHFKFTASDLERCITSKTKAVIINSPSNPTGIVYNKKELQEITEVILDKQIYVISDEIYEKIIYDGYQHTSIASLGDDIKQMTITINGLSKAYAMTGWRIGYTASNSKLAEVMANIQSHSTSNPNSIAQKAAMAALTGSQYDVSVMAKEFKARRDYAVKRINSIHGLSCIEPHGAFYIMLNISSFIGKSIDGVTINGSDDFANVLLDKARVIVVPGSGFGLDTHVRLSYATSLNNITEGLNRIEEFLRLEK